MISPSNSQARANGLSSIQEGQQIGTLAKVEPGAYSILPQGGQYLGIVRSDGNLQMTGRHPTLSPSQAQLYLDVLEAIKTLKQ